jgi:hypothetical protein
MFAISAPAQEKAKPRVFISQSTSWQVRGGGLILSGDGLGRSGGGARPQTAEIIKTFNERCKDCVVTADKDKADYVILLDHEGGKGIIRKDNKFVLFNKEGDAIRSGSTRSLGNAVKEACIAMMKDWGSNTTPSDQKD